MHQHSYHRLLSGDVQVLLIHVYFTSKYRQFYYRLDIRRWLAASTKPFTFQSLWKTWIGYAKAYFPVGMCCARLVGAMLNFSIDEAYKYICILWQWQWIDTFLNYKTDLFCWKHKIYGDKKMFHVCRGKWCSIVFRPEYSILIVPWMWLNFITTLEASFWSLGLHKINEYILRKMFSFYCCCCCCKNGNSLAEQSSKQIPAFYVFIFTMFQY